MSLKWQALSLLMRGPGRASDGIRLGYDRGFDSGENLDYIYEDQARGRFLYGRVADRLYLNAIGWRAVRNRKALLQGLLGTELEARAGAVLLDVASGPARYLVELVQEAGRPPGLEVICRDLDPAGLERGHVLAASAGLTNFRFEVGDACDPASLAAVRPRPDIVVASGIYELQNRGAIRRSMAGVRAALTPGGCFLFTTQVAHPQLELIANVLPNRLGEPWVMECRTVEEAEAWARDAGFASVESRLEPLGLFAVTRAVRPD